MAEEPKKPVEQWLDDYAQQRRHAAGPPLEMHPATRNLLQGEVARTLSPKKSEPEPRAGLWTVFWRRVAYAGSFAALAMIVTFVVRDNPPNQPPRSDFMAPLPAASPATVSTPAPMEVAESPAAPPPPVNADVRQEGLAATSDGARVMFREGAAPDAAGTRPSDGFDRGGGASPQRAQENLAQKRELTADVTRRRIEAESMESQRASGVSKLTKSREGDIRMDQPSAPVASKPSPGAAGVASPSGPATSGALRPAQLMPGDSGVAPAVVQPTLPTSPAPAQSLNELARRGADADTRRTIPPANLAAADKQMKAAEPIPADGVREEKKLSEQRALSETLARDAMAVKATALSKAAAASELVGFGIEAAVNGRFSQAAGRGQLRQNFQSPATPPVLENFEFEQLGRAIRIIDQDGSVYLGNSVPLANASATAEEAKKKLSLKDSDADIKANKYEEAVDNSGIFLNFRVAGTNRTLNQRIDFTGSVSRASQDKTDRLRSINDLDQLKRSQQSVQTNLLINGRAVIDRSQQIQINAIPTP